MKSYLKILCILLSVLVVLVLVGVYFGLNHIMCRGVETLGPELTGTPVTLDQVQLSLLSGKGELHGLTVGNPDNCKTPNAVELRKLSVHLDPRSISSDVVLIHRIEIIEPEITVEGLQAKNLTQLEEHVRKQAEKLTGTNEPVEPKEQGKKVVIEHLVIQNGKINYSPVILMGKSIPISIPDIHLEDIGKQEGGANVADVVAIVLGFLRDAVVGILKGSGDLIATGLKGMVGVAGKGAELAGDTVGAGLGLVEETATIGADVVTDSAKKLGEGVSKLADGVDKLIPGGKDNIASDSTNP